jgi:NAD-dependent dihydropyrimidine dehydrogenase PreA subunit/TorA maturation chaperone TorD
MTEQQGPGMATSELAAPELAAARVQATSGETSHTEGMTRSILLDSLAQALTDPAIMAGDALASPLAKAVITAAETLGSAACRRALFALGELPAANGEELRRRFELAINPPDARPIPMYESLALNGHLISPTTEEVGDLYRRHGLEPDGDLPDSASMELAFLAFLVEAEADALILGQASQAGALRREARNFLNDHVLAWLPLVGRTLTRCGDPHLVLYGHLLEDFLKEEQLRSLIPKGGRTRSDVPSIIAGQECGLCGFCVQSCPVGALWISENEQTTFLLLKPEQCIGCAKCLPVCPDDALGMMTRPADLATTVAVRRSQRARCPRCAAPTVSQAELTAVFARLDADETLRYRLSLCESCKATE